MEKVERKIKRALLNFRDFSNIIEINKMKFIK